jgi:hypothetical protein
VSTVFGGLHLFSADDATFDWTGSQLKRFGVAHLVGAHCTGIEAVYRLRQSAAWIERTVSWALLARRTTWEEESTQVASHGDEDACHTYPVSGTVNRFTIADPDSSPSSSDSLVPGAAS